MAELKAPLAVNDEVAPELACVCPGATDQLSPQCPPGVEPDRCGRKPDPHERTAEETVGTIDRKVFVDHHRPPDVPLGKGEPGAVRRLEAHEKDVGAQFFQPIPPAPQLRRMFAAGDSVEVTEEDEKEFASRVISQAAAVSAAVEGAEVGGIRHLIILLDRPARRR